MNDVTEQVRAPAITGPEETPPPVTHPGWCDLGRCVEADGEVQHCSAPVSLRMADADVELAWVRGDVSDEAGSQQPGAAELRVDLRYHPLCAPTALLFLAPGEVREFGHALFRCCWRERCGRPLVARPAGVVTS